MPPTPSKDDDSPPSQPQDTAPAPKRSKKKQRTQPQPQREQQPPSPVPLPPPPLTAELPDEPAQEDPPQEVHDEPQDPPIYAKQMYAPPLSSSALRPNPSSRAKSPPFAFRSLHSHPPRQGTAMLSPDLPPEHSPPSISPRYISDQWNGGLHPLASKHSPPNHFSLNGSPPVYENSFPESWTGTRTPSISPPVGSLPRSGPYGIQPNNSRRRLSREVMHDARAQHPMAAITHPPLPHQTQPHFYGAPDPNKMVPRQIKQGVRPGERGYNVSFDSIQRNDSESSDNVVLIGSEGCLDIYRLEKIKLHKIGHIEGLRGAVVGAKILPVSRTCGQSDSRRPLIALIIHGPMLSPSSAATTNNETSAAEMRPASPFESGPIQYQTSVEIYSLRSHEHVATLFESRPIPCYESPLDPLFTKPQPAGELRLSTSARYLALASGVSGEIWIFDCFHNQEFSKGLRPFRCIAKYWTTLQRTAPKERPTSGHLEQLETTPSVQKRQPLYSLEGRWLAIVPPPSSSQSVLKGSFPSTPGLDKVAGLNTFTPPSAPLVDCNVESPGDASMLNRVARGLTQEMIKGATWMGTQGMSALRTYWNRSNTPSAINGSSQPPAEPWFPPTHGEQLNASDTARRNAMVSIIDLHKLSEQATNFTRLPDPVATFEAPGGCSFVSLSPTGLHLLTVSHAGDEQFVWDLMKLKPTTARNTDYNRTTNGGKSTGPIVRQVARFQRYTEAQVVDVIWSEPRGDKLAIITHRGTIHLFEMPEMAFQWPPRPLLKLGPADASRSTATSNGSAQSTGQGGTSPSTMQSLNGSTKGLVDAFRKHGTAGLSALTSNLNITPARGRQVVASGVQRGLGAAAGGLVQLRHLGENRIRLSPGSNAVAPCLVRILTGSARGFVGAISGDVLRVHTLPRLDRSSSTASPRTQYASAKDFEFELPSIADDRVSPAAYAALFSTDEPQLLQVSGSWAGTHYRSAATSETESPDPAAALSFAEIDTTSPFQPFHTDRRVTLSVYISAPDGGAGDKPWAFGEDIATSVVHAPPASLPSASTAASIPNLLDENFGGLNDEDLLAAEQLIGEEDDFEVLNDV